ncbi:MAG TPA: pectin acetylesterase-family hydrolase [Ilumatobacter sp.]|nr:pectin acetylesterase-family hydrolase [Ilumatobacter sp.]
MQRRQRFLAAGSVVCLVAALAACSDDANDQQSTDTATTPATTVADTVDTVPATTADVAPATTEVTETTEKTTEVTETTEVPDTTEVPETTAAAQPAAWNSFQLDDCQCSDGSEVTFFQRDADPTKVVLYFEGGGACFSLETCDPNGDPTYSMTSPDSGGFLTNRGGLFDFENAENPLTDHSFIYVPYCTGDVHSGDATTEYGEGVDGEDVVIEHRGFPNGMAALDHLVSEYPEIEQLVVTGASAGSVPTPLFAGLASDLLPDADIVTFGDSSGAYPDVPALNAGIGALWGTMNAVPDWPATADVTPETWSLPGMYVYAGLHAPNVRFGRFDYAFDETQSAFSALAGIPADELVTLIDGTEQMAEDAGVSVAKYVAAGDEHTIIGSDELYEMETEGVRLIDWITELITGENAPADIHCEICT